MRYQTHYQLKQKLWLEPFGNRQAIGGNELIHSGLFKYTTWALAVANCANYNIGVIYVSY